MTIESAVLREPAPGQGRVVAVFSYRYDAHLVPGLLENIAPFVHAWVAWDDCGADTAMSDEPTRRNLLLQQAAVLRADWILACDPDERFETALAARMPAMTGDGPAIWTFALREMVGPAVYRVDGLWGGKRQPRLFPASPAMRAAPQRLHGRWIPEGSGLRTIHSNLNLYHLRMATARRRQHRRDTYAAADPDRSWQRIGYDYLCDDRGMVAEPIPDGRGFLPPHQDDDGLWAPALADLGQPQPDPPQARLRFVAVSRQRRAALAAAHVIGDMQAEDPGDTDLTSIAAQLALEAGDHAAIDSGVQALVKAQSRQAFALTVRARARIALGQRGAAHDDLEIVGRYVPPGPTLNALRAQTETSGRRFGAAGALWRRWARGRAQLLDGPANAKAAIVVVVIGYLGPQSLRRAVRSLLAQSVVPEIVVVNSGGGNPAQILAGELPSLRLINVQRRLFVGAARNIGIDASAAGIVAFLAADCVAAPGWVEQRLLAHAAGAAAVSSPVLPMVPDSPASQAASAITHRRRWPDVPADSVAHYGLSYDRALFLAHGYFPVGLRVGEDTALNDVIAASRRISFAPGVVTLHDYPTRPLALMRDMVARGVRRAAHPPFDALAAQARPWPRILRLARQRTQASLAAVRQVKGGVWTRLLVRAAITGDTLGIVLGLRRVRHAHRARDSATALLPQDPAAALAVLRPALAAFGQDWRLHLLHAEALQGLGDSGSMAKALDAVRRARDIAPRESGPLVAEVRLLRKMGDLPAALTACDAAIAVAPDVWTFLVPCCRPCRYTEVATCGAVLRAGRAGPVAFARAGASDGCAGAADAAARWFGRTPRSARAPADGSRQRAGPGPRGRRPPLGGDVWTFGQAPLYPQATRQPSG